MRSSGSNSPDSINSIKVRSWRETVWSWPGWRPSIPFQVAKTVKFHRGGSSRHPKKKLSLSLVNHWLFIQFKLRRVFLSLSGFSTTNHLWMWKALCARPTTQPMHSGLLRLVVYSSKQIQTFIGDSGISSHQPKPPNTCGLLLFCDASKPEG